MKSMLILATLFTGGTAHAYSSLDHSCAEVQSEVQSRGAVVIHTGHGTYERYVNSSYYCATGLYADPAWIPTADEDSCYVGYTCEAGGGSGRNGGGSALVE